MVFKHYTTNDTAIIKGTAILLICLHNFFHWLPPSPGENEFLFFSESIGNLFNLLAEKPQEFVNILFSYFGHFGVQMFLLISGYGLTMSMMKNERSWLPFFWERIKKLYPLLIVGVLFLFLTITLTEGRLFSDTEQTELCYKLLFIQTLVPGSALTLNGPWWFFALILQLYIFYPILYRLTKRFGWKAFLSICLISYAIIYIYKFQLGLFDGEMIMMNMPGHLPEFCLGILLATNKQPKISIVCLLIAITLFVLCNFYIYFYPFTFLAIAVITVFTYQGLKAIPARKRILKKTLIHFGGISMAIFAVHGALRHPILKFAGIYDNAAWHLLAGVVFLLTVWCASIAAKKIYELITKPLAKVQINDCRATRITGNILQSALIAFFTIIAAYYTYAGIDIKQPNLISSGEMVESGTIGTADTYSRITRLDIDKRYTNLQIEGSVEYKGAEAIPIVLEIPDMVWTKFDIPENHDGEFKEFHFSYKYVVPFVKNTKKNVLKIYFWNKDGHCGEFKNAKVSISH